MTVLYSWLPIGTYYKNLAIWWKSGFLEIWWIIWPIICMKNPLQRTLPVRKALTIMAYYWVHLCDSVVNSVELWCCKRSKTLKLALLLLTKKGGHVQIWRRCHVHGCQIHFTKVLDKLLANPFCFIPLFTLAQIGGVDGDALSYFSTKFVYNNNIIITIFTIPPPPPPPTTTFTSCSLQTLSKSHYEFYLLEVSLVWAPT